MNWSPKRSASMLSSSMGCGLTVSQKLVDVTSKHHPALSRSTVLNLLATSEWQDWNNWKLMSYSSHIRWTNGYELSFYYFIIYKACQENVYKIKRNNRVIQYFSLQNTEVHFFVFCIEVLQLSHNCCYGGHLDTQYGE